MLFTLIAIFLVRFVCIMNTVNVNVFFLDKSTIFHFDIIYSGGVDLVYFVDSTNNQLVVISGIHNNKNIKTTTHNV